MDKPKKENTIKIKINGQVSPYKEDSLIDSQRINEKSSVGPNLETQSINKTTDSSFKSLDRLEMAASKETNQNDAFEWVLPTMKRHVDEDDVEDYEVEDYIVNDKTKKNHKLKKNNYFSKEINRNKGKKLGKVINMSMFLAVFFAVLLGTFFGLMLLKVVPSEKVNQNTPTIKHELPEEKTNDNEEKSVNSTTHGDNTNNIQVTLQAFSASVVQEGIYSSELAAKKIKQSLKEKGIASEIFPINGQFALYVGAAKSIDDAKELGSELQKKGISTFSKEIMINEKTVNHINKDEKKLLELSPNMLDILLQSVTLTSRPPQLNQLEKEFAQLDKIDKKKIQQDNIKKLYLQFEAASIQFKIYEQNPNPSTLNVIQQHMLTILSIYQKV